MAGQAIPLSLLIEIERVLDEARAALASQHTEAANTAVVHCAMTAGRVAYIIKCHAELVSVPVSTPQGVAA